MYDLGEQFKYDISNSMANLDCTFKGSKYRITVLTERLVRLEYSDTGVFNDSPTELVSSRKFEKPNFFVEENNSILKITTRYFQLVYSKEKKFRASKLTPMKNLKISLLNTENIWYYGHPEIKNFRYSSYQNKKYKIVEEKALYSLDGFASIDDSQSNLILENGQIILNENKEIDIYVFMYNKDYYYCLNDYFQLTGYPPLIPRYALGCWWSKNTVYDENQIVHTVRKFKQHGVPISVFILNNWENKKYQLNEKYSEFSKIITLLNKNQVRLGLSLCNFGSFDENTNNYEQLKAYLPLKNDKTIDFDAYNPRVIDAYLKLLIHPLDSLGSNFYFMDYFNSDKIKKLSLIRNYLYMDKSKNQLRPFLCTYNYSIAAHKYSILYSGKLDVSFDSLKKIAKFNSSASNIGLSFISQDFGGSLGGIENSELFTRFVQLGTFSSILKLSSDTSKYYKREPWKWDITTSEITTNFINLRYRLIPYIYTEAYKYYKYGKPLIEPIYYRYPDKYDDILHVNNYFFGSTFYVSPILSKKEPLIDRVIHKLYIPDGVWYDFFTGKKYSGNKKYVSFYKTNEYPVFVKSGAIIPMSVSNFNDTNIPQQLEILVFPGSNNAYSIYEDDGISNGYLNGSYAITNIELMCKQNHYALTILPVAGNSALLPKTRDYKIRFKNTKTTANVMCYEDGKEIQYKKSKSSTDLIVDIPDTHTGSQLTVICSGNNIEIEAIRIINEDLVSIISDLPIKTVIKQKIDNVLFNDSLPLNKKRIEIRKLGSGKNYLDRKYVDLFLKLLEYINEV